MRQRRSRPIGLTRVLRCAGALAGTIGLIAGTASIAACGQKGPLVLPTAAPASAAANGSPKP